MEFSAINRPSCVEKIDDGWAEICKSMCSRKKMTIFWTLKQWGAWYICIFCNGFSSQGMVIVVIKKAIHHGCVFLKMIDVFLVCKLPVALYRSIMHVILAPLNPPKCLGTSKSISCLKTSIWIIQWAIQTLNNPTKKTPFLCVFQWHFFSFFWPKQPPFLGTLTPGPVQLGVWWRTCWRQWIICTAMGCCSDERFFFLTPLPSAVRKKTWLSLFFPWFSAWKTLPSTFLLEEFGSNGS